jgi:hypothetical protein
MQGGEKVWEHQRLEKKKELCRSLFLCFSAAALPTFWMKCQGEIGHRGFGEGCGGLTGKAVAHGVFFSQV